MKSYIHKLVVFTTAFLVIYIVLAHYGLPFTVLFAMCIAGQALTIYMVYKILTDDYKTDKTFKDWYEDEPVETLED